MIKQTLKDANKYEDIIKILTDITNVQETSLPVDAFVDEENVTRWRVEGWLVRKEAQETLDIIEGTIRQDNYNLFNVLQYVRSQSNMMLHNYAVRLSHRNKPLDDMDSIRSWEILEHLIAYLCNKEDTKAFFGKRYEWTIPDGWKRTSQTNK